MKTLRSFNSIYYFSLKLWTHVLQMPTKIFAEIILFFFNQKYWGIRKRAWYLHVLKNHVFLDKYKKDKTKQILHTFVDIAKETACEKIQRQDSLLELELLEVLVSLNKMPDFWKSLSKIIYIIFYCRTSMKSHNKEMCAYIKKLFQGLYKVLRFSITPDYFLIFRFCIKGNQDYYTWITYKPALLVNVHILFSQCVKLNTWEWEVREIWLN